MCVCVSVWESERESSCMLLSRFLMSSTRVDQHMCAICVGLLVQLSPVWWTLIILCLSLSFSSLLLNKTAVLLCFFPQRKVSGGQKAPAMNETRMNEFKEWERADWTISSLIVQRRLSLSLSLSQIIGVLLCFWEITGRIISDLSGLYLNQNKSHR